MPSRRHRSCFAVRKNNHPEKAASQRLVWNDERPAIPEGIECVLSLQTNPSGRLFATVTRQTAAFKDRSDIHLEIDPLTGTGIGKNGVNIPRIHCPICARAKRQSKQRKSSEKRKQPEQTLDMAANQIPSHSKQGKVKRILPAFTGLRTDDLCGHTTTEKLREGLIHCFTRHATWNGIG